MARFFNVIALLLDVILDW